MIRAGLVFLALAGPVAAETVAPRLGAASNFGQGWQPDMLAAAPKLPVAEFRDGAYWSNVERAPGTYLFDKERTRYPDRLEAMGARLTFIVNNGHPDWDDGHTPASAEAVAAFAAYAAEAVRRFPAIHAVEVGNEMNSEVFVSGPGWDGDLGPRAESYTRLLAATAEAVRAVRPEVRIYGGAAHSVSLTWFRALAEAGAFAHMDAIALHPYVVAPEMLVRTVALLREIPGADLPLEITEFGDPDPASAPGHLMRSYCQFALAGATGATWYPLNPRGDGMTPLLDAEGGVTGVGRAFALARAELEGRPVDEIAPDPFTYGCRFGEDRALIWGEIREVEILDPAVRVRGPDGTEIAGDRPEIGPRAPLLLSRDDGAALVLGEDYRLAPTALTRDSLHQFAWPGTVEAPFTLLARAGDEEVPMELRPGQERAGVPWDPYLATAIDGVARAGPGWVLPSHPAGGPIEIVTRTTIDRHGPADLLVQIAPSARTTDGVTLRVAVNDHTHGEWTVTQAKGVWIPDLYFVAGDTLDVAVGPGAEAVGDTTRLQVQLFAR